MPSHSPAKIVSLFEPHTEIIRKGKAGKPTEFGKMVKIQEAEQQIVTHYEVYDRRPADSDLLVPAVEEHLRQFGHAPRLVTADAGFFSAANEAASRELGVQRVSMPNHSSKSPQRRAARAQALVPRGPALAYRMRRTHQPAQAQAWTRSLSLQRRGRHEALGRARCHRR